MLKEILVYRIKRRGRRKKYNAKSSIAEAISLSLKLVGMYNGAMPKKYLQKQPPDIFYKNRVFRKIRRKMPVLQSLFNTATSPRPATSLSQVLLSEFCEVFRNT